MPALAKALGDIDDKDLNCAAVAYALGKIGPGAIAAESALLKHLATKDDNLRILTAWALAQIHPTSTDVAIKVVPVLIDGLALPEVADRLFAAEALGNFGPLAKSAAVALKKAASDEDKNVQEAAAKSLKAVEPNAPAAPKTATTPAAPASPAAPATPVEPAKATGLLRPGEFVVTVEDKVEVGVKGRAGETVAKGTKLKVMEVRGSWVGVKIDGADKTGWVLVEQVSRP